MAELEHKFATANGIRIHYVTSGTGPLVVLLHGFPQFWYAWRYQIPELATQFKVVAPDLRGYGDTDKPPKVSDYRTSILADDIADLIKAIGYEKAHIVGHDWGGGIAWVLASKHPQVVDRLAVINCPHPKIFLQALRSNPKQIKKSWYIFFLQLPFLPELLFRLSPKGILKRMLRDTSKRKEAFSNDDIEKYAKELMKPGALSAAINYYRASFRSISNAGERQNNDKSIEATTLLIWGEDDVALGKELTLGMDPLFKNAFRIHYIPNCGHWVNEEQPELINQVLMEYLADGNDKSQPFKE